MRHNETIDKYIKQLNQYTSYEYLELYLDQPTIEKYKVLALHVLTEENDQQESLLLSAMLVQIALNTHDRVDKQYKHSSTKLFKGQQLTVLAGDYFSGIYYHLLAHHGNRDFIPALARGIKDITKLKLSVYYHEYEQMNDFFQDFIKVESMIIKHVAHYMEKAEHFEYIENWLMLMKLKYERYLIQQNQLTFFHELILNNVKQPLTIELIDKHFTEWIDKITGKLEILASNLPAYLQPLHDFNMYNIYDFIQSSSSLMEEGLSK
ncbi:heptaprenyl diphosphate synthase component 1 [Gracilibacillus sp. YIM 98692]|uniref:heptaprenyl diphosphate synthase component 1 n=1 Tax=Gracilibacillus sp. YIM 98692 TaxID=2663532 RepID=UPI0013D511A8|nr:heptaprenyl diphosphate synthase component 1 [Gracilibacillus sp. YIM 98692]